MCDIIQTNQINIYPQLFCCNHNVCEHDAEIKFVVFAKQSAMSDSLFGKDMDTVFINDKTPWLTVKCRWCQSGHFQKFFYKSSRNAALGCAQLENLDKYVASKRKVATEYIEHFKNVDGIDFFAEPENTFSNYWLSAVVLKDKESQFDFLQQTNDNGVMTRPIWELMSRLPMFDNCQNDGLQNTI